MPKVKYIETEMAGKEIPTAYRKFACVKCGKEKSLKEYYKSKTKLWESLGHLGICKSCAIEYYEYYYNKYVDVEKALYFLCQTVDMPFVNSVVDFAKEQSKRTGSTLVGFYFKGINSWNNEVHPNCFHDGTRWDIIDDLSDDEEQQIVDTRDELVVFWGDNYSDSELLFLQREYDSWVKRYDVSSKSMEVYVKEICYQQLTIANRRKSREAVDKDIKVLRDLMTDSALKPLSESAMMSADKNTLGTWIKLWENEKPVPKVDPEFEDVDNIRKFIRIWFLGHLCKMLGLDNKFSEEYEQEMAKYAINVDGDE